MPFDAIYLLYGAIFLAALLFVEGLYYLYADGQTGRDAVNRRMRMLEKKGDTAEVFSALRRPARKGIAVFGSLGELLPRFDHMIQQAGMTISLHRMLLLMGALTAGSFIAVIVLARNSAVLGNVSTLVIAAIVGVSVGIVLPVVVVQSKKTKRLKTFGEQLPDALDAMVRSLHAGHPISAALGLVARDMPDPIGTEFGLAVDEMTYGLELREALANMGERIDLEDFQYVVVAINIQHETGGNLAEVLQGLSNVIRSRFRMFKKIRALSAEGRLSAKILAVLPFLFGAWTFAIKPHYYLEAVPDPLFFPILGVALGLELLGIYIMYKLVNFRV